LPQSDETGARLAHSPSEQFRMMAPFSGVSEFYCQDSI
jgi:hypothetical protein